MKTGTTYLQDLMTANREELAKAGYLFPGAVWADQSLAAQDVLGFSEDDEPDQRPELVGRWAAIAEEMLSYDGKASLFSMEFLSFAGTEQATRIVDSLEGADLHVILTVRDAAKTIPAQWQTGCRNGNQVPFRRFVYSVRDVLESDGPPEGRAARMIERTQDVGRMLDVWVPLLGPEKVHVVTVPPRGSDPTLLWSRFASVVKMRPSVASRPVPNTNTSLGHASTELLRLINAELGSVPRRDYASVVKKALARKILGSRAHLETPLQLHRRGKAFAARWNARVRQAVVAHEVDVVGDLEDLPTERPPKDLKKMLHWPTDEEMLAAAATVRDGLHHFSDHLRAAIAAPELGIGTPAQTFRPSDNYDSTSAQHWDDRPEPLPAAVTEITELIKGCMELTHQWEKARDDLALAEQHPAASARS